VIHTWSAFCKEFPDSNGGVDVERLLQKKIKDADFGGPHLRLDKLYTSMQNEIDFINNLPSMNSLGKYLVITS
jgi:hypothetical protein